MELGPIHWNYGSVIERYNLRGRVPEPKKG